MLYIFTDILTSVNKNIGENIKHVYTGHFIFHHAADSTRQVRDEMFNISQEITELKIEDEQV